jgi:hypothetical protein
MSQKRALESLLGILLFWGIALDLAVGLPNHFGPCQPARLEQDRAAYRQAAADWKLANHAASLVRDPEELAGSILVLSNVRDRAWRQSVGPCLLPANIEQLKGMDAMIKGYQAAQAGQDLAVMMGDFRRAASHFRRADEAAQ